MKKNEMITIDGSQGEGGGQILRSSLSLSLHSGRPFRMINIRAGRKKPGLLRQHLTAITAATQVGDAVADGVSIGSGEIVFHPQSLRAGEYHFAVGTAGSTMLVLQTILPALMLTSGPSRVVLEGGTHNPFAPTFDFVSQTFLPQLARFGPRVEAQLVRPGFYPAGGGRIEITIHPVAQLQEIDLRERGEDVGRRVVAHVAALSPHIAERTFERFEKRMQWSRDCFEIVEHPDDCGPGFVLSAEVASSEIREVFTGFGEKGVRAETVANSVVDDTRQYLASSAPVGEYLADQLLVPLALAGRGVFRATGLSRHARTNIDVIHQFLPVRLQTSEGEGGVEVRVEA